MPALTRRPGLLPRLDQVPQVAVQVPEDGDDAVGLLLRLAQEDDAARSIRLRVAPEVGGAEGEAHAATGRCIRLVLALKAVGVEEEEHAPPGLVADSRLLLRGRSARQQQPRPAS